MFMAQTKQQQNAASDCPSPKMKLEMALLVPTNILSVIHLPLQMHPFEQRSSFSNRYQDHIAA
jgi:hypothetical protein